MQLEKNRVSQSRLLRHNNNYCMTKPQDKRMNEAIRASQVRVITEEGENL
jgi:hypothetical protein